MSPPAAGFGLTGGGGAGLFWAAVKMPVDLSYFGDEGHRRRDFLIGTQRSEQEQEPGAEPEPRTTLYQVQNEPLQLWDQSLKEH